MLYQGKEIVYDEKKSINIQKIINQTDDIEFDLKSEVKPSAQDDKESDLSFGSWNVFDQEGEQLVNRKARYEYFKEMDDMEFIHRAIEIVADDSTQSNQDGNVLKVYSDDEKIKSIIEDLFFERLDLNNELWTIIFETCKMGDNFYEIIVDNYDKPKKVVLIRFLEPEKVERIEKDGKLSHFNYKRKANSEEERRKGDEVIYKLQPWQIIHFKLDNKKYTPYGASLLYPGIKSFRRLSLLEDIMLVYRISRAPERRVFYIDVGNLNAVQAKQFLQKIKAQYRTQPFIDEDGKINKKAHTMSITSDIFVPVREGTQGTRIETLQGGEALHNIDDLKYFRDKILKTMNIPAAYLGDEADRSRGSLAQLDSKFGRFIERIQSQIVKGLNKIASLELFFNKYKKEDLKNFQIELTPPSNIKEVTEIDMINQRMALLATIQQLDIFSKEWMLKNILKMSDKEISDIALYKTLEQSANPQAGAEAGGMPPAASGGPEGAEQPAEGGFLPPTEGQPETPPEGETPAAETPPEDLTASTIINMFGKEFIVENAKDFKKILKAAELYGSKNNDTSLIVESLQNMFFQSDNYKKKSINTNNSEHLLIINELGGLNFESGSIKLWEGKIYKTRQDVSGRYRTKKILRG
jgi:hypothetical protein